MIITQTTVKICGILTFIWFIRQKTNKNWEAYRKQRNFVNKLKKKSVQKYFYERCAGGPKSSDFWPTIKPFLSSKGVKTNNSITLSENNDVIGPVTTGFASLIIFAEIQSKPVAFLYSICLSVYRQKLV
jgi:hypothetical protein